MTVFFPCQKCSRLTTLLLCVLCGGGWRKS